MSFRLAVVIIWIVILIACEPVRVKTHRERTDPTQPPSPTETAAISPPAPSSPSAPAKPVRAKTYAETVLEWKSYQDLIRWLEKDFSLDTIRFKRFERTLPPPRSPEETFDLKSGIYIDVATFAKETLNRMDPSYKARIVILIIRPNVVNHYVCSFTKEGKLFIIDYGTPYSSVTGLQGPYQSLEEYKRFYEKNHPMKRQVEAIRYLP